jgi:hypothetical protein
MNCLRTVAGHWLLDHNCSTNIWKELKTVDVNKIRKGNQTSCWKHQVISALLITAHDNDMRDLFFKQLGLYNTVEIDVAYKVKKDCSSHSNISL